MELTARIGKELLTENQKLETNVVTLEAQLKSANEKITQLNHELRKKTELIQILTNDVEESGSESGIGRVVALLCTCPRVSVVCSFSLGLCHRYSDGLEMYQPGTYAEANWLFGR